MSNFSLQNYDEVCAIRFYVICNTANIVKWDLFYDTHNVRYKTHVYTFYSAIIGCLIYTQILLISVFISYQGQIL